MIYRVKPNDLRFDTAVASVDVWVPHNISEPIEVFHKNVLSVGHHSAVFVEDVQKDESLYDVLNLIPSSSLRIFLDTNDKLFHSFHAVFRQILFKVLPVDNFGLESALFGEGFVVGRNE